MSFVNQSQSVVMQNQRKREITLDTQMKTALMLTYLLTSYTFVDVAVIYKMKYGLIKIS